MTQIKGIAASRGIGIGHVCIITEHELKYTAKRTDDAASEKMRLNLALEKFKKNTTEIAADFKKKLGSREAEILDGHLLIISDPVMKDEMYKRIASGQCAEAAVEAVCDMFIEKFSKLEDDMMRQRAYDISDIKVRILKILLGIEEISISDVAPGTVIVAKELTPSMVSQINKENVAGIVAETGTETSHSAILAEALEIPTVLSVKSALKLMKNNDTVIVDGKDGLVYIEPDEGVLSEYAKKRKAFMQRESELKKFSYAKTITADGTRLNLFCNIGTPEQAQKAAECGCEGIGLLRSEFLFINNSRMPSEEEQLAAYKKAVQIMDCKPVIIRTLDVGADKAVSYLNIQKEENPFLGYRAVRYCL